MRAGFVEYEPVRPLQTKVRRIFVTPQIAILLSGKGDVNLMFPSVDAERLVSKFCNGWLVSVSRKSKPTELEQLENLDDVWAMCFRKPAPGWRVFGRFLDKNVFVGLAAHDRYELVPKLTYHAKAKAIIADWDRLLPGVSPLRSKKLQDYLGQGYYDYDQG